MSALYVDVGALRAAVAGLTAELDGSRRREGEAKTRYVSICILHVSMCLPYMSLYVCLMCREQEAGRRGQDAAVGAQGHLPQGIARLECAISHA